MNKLVYSLVCLCFLSGALHSANLYWVAGAASNWNNSANWSAISGGTGGAGVPGTGDIAVFNGAGLNACTINVNASVAGFSIVSSYSGAISFNSGITLTVGTSNFSQASGTFSGNNGNITLNGSLSLSGGTFNSTAGTLLITGGYTYSGGTFNHNNGTVSFSNSQNFSGNMTFYDVLFNANSADYNIASGQTLTSVHNVSISGTSWYRINTGTLEMKGDLTLVSSANNSVNGGSATYLFDGTGTQNINASAISSFNYTGALGKVQINKTSGALNFSGIINFNGTSWITTAGTSLINAGTSTVNILNTTTFSGQDLSLYDIFIPATAQDINITAGQKIASTHNITINGTNWYRINTGTLEIKGDLTLTASTNNSVNGGSATYLFDGTGAQNINSAATASNYVTALGNVQVNKTSGSLALNGLINFNGTSWITTAGTSLINAGTSTFNILNTTTFSGQDLSLYDIFIPATAQDINITSGQKLTSTHNVTINGANWYRINTGTLEIQGDLTLTASANNSVNGGSATYLFDGSGAQNINSAATASNYVTALGNVQVNKTSGSLALNGLINFNGTSWITTAGTSLINAGTSTFNILNTTTFSGQNLSLYDIFIPATGQDININPGVVLTSNHNVTINGTNWYRINTGTLEIKGDLTLTTSANNSVNGGSATYLFDGTGTQNINSAAGAYNYVAALGSVQVNKVSGALNFTGIINFNGTAWATTAGTSLINAGTSALNILNTTTFSGQDLSMYDIYIPATGQDINIGAGQKLSSTHTVTINGTSWYRINTGTLEILGDLMLTNSANNSVNGGSATYLFDGTGTQNINSAATAYNYVTALGGVQVNKSSGALNLIGIINFNGTAWTTTAGTSLINAGTSTLDILNTTTFSGQNLSLYDIYIPATGQDINISSGLLLTSNHNVTINGTSWYRINTGMLEIKGDLTLLTSANNSVNGGTATFLFDGTGVQNINAAAVTTLNYICALGKVQINKISGALNFSGIINFNGTSWITTAGTSLINAGTSVVDILNTTTFSGQNLSLYDIYIPATGQDINISSGVLLTSNHNTTINGTNWYRINTGTLEIKGDLTLLSSANNSVNGGTATFLFDGTGAQNINASAVTTYNYICAIANVQINKTSGTLDMSGIINFTGSSWNTIAGNTLIVPGTSAVDLLGTSTLSGQNISLYDIYVAGTSQTITISSGLTWTSSHLITLGGTSGYTINTGTFNPQGDVTITNTNNSTGGTATFLFDGTANQLLTGSGASNKGRLPKVTINKTGGTLTFGSNLISEMNDWTYIQGTVDAATNSSLVEFTGSLIVDPQGTSSTMKFYDAQIISATSTLAGNFDIGHNLTFLSGGLDVSASLFPVTIQGSWIQNYTTTGAFVERTGTVTFNGTSAQTIYNNGISAGETFYNLVISNPAGVTLAGTANYNVNISGTTVGLNLANGLLTTSLTNLVVITSGAVSTGVSNTSFVNGPCQKIGTQAFTFPVGKGNYYRPISISAPATSSTFTAEHFNTTSNPTYPHSSVVATLATLDNCEYWILNRGTGGTPANVSVTLSWNTTAFPVCTIGYLPGLKVARWDATLAQWQDQGNGGTIGTIAAGTIISSGAVTSFSPFTLASNTWLNPLPIELLSFTAKPEGTKVDLAWATASENNNDFFTVERSADGSVFESVAKVDGAGSSDQTLNYASADLQPYSGLSYYRLKQTDKNGESTYSSVVPVEFKEEPLDFNIYPNPSGADNISIALHAAKGEEISLTLNDISGRQVYAKTITAETSENILMAIAPPEKLASGVYIISANSGTATCRKKLIIR